VGFGMGKQEKFIADNWGKLEVKLAMGVGGAFDYFSGNVPRAPKVLRRAGLEWLYRLIRQPWRVRRQLALVKFVWLVIKEKFVFFCEML
jgi:N-acetylglucosaminyldiphosphoundecaprenol N-acetyl-beta-D-mannosaminyltransferase